jgi:hypothetical protein
VVLAGVTVIADVEAPPGFQMYDVPPLAVKVTVPDPQNEVGPEAVIEAVGLVYTVSVWLAVAVQPAELVTVTLYTAPAVAVMEVFVVPLYHR